MPEDRDDTEVREEQDNLSRLAADDTNANPPLWQSGGKFVLWLALLAWFAVLGNYRIGNPLALPAPGIFQRINAFAAPSGGEPAAQAVSGEAIPEVKPQESVAKPAAVPEVPSKAMPAGQPSGRAEQPIAAWGGKLLENLKKGDFEAAAAVARGADSAIGDDIAVLLTAIPDADALVVEAIMASRGEEIAISFNGKERRMIPESSLETVITATFNGRAIEVDAAKLSDVEKLRLIGQVAGDDPPRHAAAIPLALRSGDKEALRAHLRKAGPLARLLDR